MIKRGTTPYYPFAYFVCWTELYFNWNEIFYQSQRVSELSQITGSVEPVQNKQQYARMQHKVYTRNPN